MGHVKREIWENSPFSLPQFAFFVLKFAFALAISRCPSIAIFNKDEDYDNNDDQIDNQHYDYRNDHEDDEHDNGRTRVNDRTGRKGKNLRQEEEKWMETTTTPLHVRRLP